MAKLLYLEDIYRAEAFTTVLGITEKGCILLDEILFSNVWRAAGRQRTLDLGRR